MTAMEFLNLSSLKNNSNVSFKITIANRPEMGKHS